LSIIGLKISGGDLALCEGVWESKIIHSILFFFEFNSKRFK